jgi:hypothetical protein
LISTTRRMISGEELKYLKQLGGLAWDVRLIRSASGPTAQLPHWSDKALRARDWCC